VAVEISILLTKIIMNLQNLLINKIQNFWKKNLNLIIYLEIQSKQLENGIVLKGICIIIC
jgi:hypothetical protein